MAPPSHHTTACHRPSNGSAGLLRPASLGVVGIMACCAVLLVMPWRPVVPPSPRTVTVSRPVTASPEQRHEVRRVAAPTPDVFTDRYHEFGWADKGVVLPDCPVGYRWDVVVGSLAAESIRTHVQLTQTEQPPTIPVEVLARDRRQVDRRRTVLPQPTPPAPKPSGELYYLPGTNGDLTRPEAWVKIAGREAATGRWVRVLVDSRLPSSELAPGLLAAIVDNLERRIYPVAVRAWGNEAVPTVQTPLTVLLTPWVGRLSAANPQGGMASTDGTGTDGTSPGGTGSSSPAAGVTSGLFRPEDLRTDLEAPFSCGRPVLYLNSSLRPGPHLHAVLAHEYTHYAVCSRRLQAVGPARQDDWLNEGLAHVGEIQLGAAPTNLASRVEAFLRSPSTSPLVIEDAAASGRWRDPACRGAAYLFTLWCAERYGTGFIADLAAEPVRGTEGLAQLFGEPFEQLFLQWMESLAQRGELTATPADQPLELWGTAVGRMQLSHDEHRWKISGERVLVLAKMVPVKL